MRRRPLSSCSVRLRHAALPCCIVVLAACGGVPDDNGVGSMQGPESAVPIARPGLVELPADALYGNYSPAQIRHAYGFDKLSGTGSGQTIGIVDACGSSTIQNDLNEFSKTYGIPSTTITIHNFGGPACSGWAAEISLDVEWAHAIADDAKILLVIAKSTQITDLLSAVDYAREQGARQVSMSWGAPEFSGEGGDDSHFNQSGYSFFASTGDSGHGTWWPSTSPYVVAVGGTTLDLDSKGNVLSDTAWSGTGGGTSSQESKPAYQDGWQSSSYRQVPDVAYVGDPTTGVAFYCSDSSDSSCPGSEHWFVGGGTSVGPPQLAAMMAIVNQGRKTYLSNVVTDIYKDAGTAPKINPSEFYDITSGCDGKGDCAKTGYDAVSGLGAPLANALVPSLQKN